MTGEEWARYVERLSGEWREFAQNVMLRVSRLINRDRNTLLEDMQRVERRTNENTARWREMESAVSRYLAQQDRLEERIDIQDERLAALAEQLARLQRGGNES